MKQIFTLLSLIVLSIAANAQFSENFDNYSSLASNCWQLNNVSAVNGNGNSAINNTSVSTDLVLNGELTTPYLDFNSSITLSFNYRVNRKLDKAVSILVQIGTTDGTGTFYEADRFTADNSLAQNLVYTYKKSLNLSAGTRRFTIKVNMLNSDGKSLVVFDDLAINGAALHYLSQSCNTAPFVKNANFKPVAYSAYNGTLVDSASDINAGETLTFAAETLPSGGDLVFNSNGTFTFTPYGNFTGGTVTFTYYVTDNGYNPMQSNRGTVTIVYPSQASSILPVTLTNFAGTIASSKVQLTWSVAQNEEGNYFQIEKSSDGKSFTAVAVVMNTTKSGAETYNYTDANSTGAVYYRLKVVSKTAAFFYSRTIAVQEAGAASASNLTLLQNPVNTTLRFTYKAVANGTGVVNVYTMSGVKVFSTSLAVRSGLNQTALNLDNRLTPGAYILEMVNGTDRSLAKVVKN